MSSVISAMLNLALPSGERKGGMTVDVIGRTDSVGHPEAVVAGGAEAGAGATMMTGTAEMTDENLIAEEDDTTKIIATAGVPTTIDSRIVVADTEPVPVDLQVDIVNLPQIR
jgi:hypothetical protein